MLFWNFTYDGADRAYRGYGETVEQATNDVREMLEEGLEPGELQNLRMVDGPHTLDVKTDFGPNGPKPGTYAYTAMLMHQLCPPDEIGESPDFWDTWKDEMKDAML